MNRTDYSEFDKYDFDDPDQFLTVLHTLVDESVERNLELIENLPGDGPSEAYRQCVSDIVNAFHEAGLFQGVDDDESTIAIAFQTLRICKVFLHAFDISYANASTHVKNRKSLEDQFNL